MKEGPPDNGLHFPDLSIRGFRGIKDLSISGLGRVTLITGKNNTGKSSILEALRLHTRNAAPSVIYDILAFREENLRRADEEEGFVDPESVFHVFALFHGFPSLSEDFGPIVISTSGGARSMELTLRVDWFAEERDADGNRRLVSQQGPPFDEPQGVAALVVETEGGKRTHRLEDLARYSRLRGVPRSISSNGARMPCILVSSHEGKATNELGVLWDEIVLTDDERHIVEALRVITPEIAAVSMVGEESPTRGRTAIVRTEGTPRPVPLRSFGDGMNRLFAIVLSVVKARGGLLLVDEFENGLHHTVQLEAWRMIFRLAQSLDIQVFATTHSWDTIEAFQEAAAETPEDGALVRLTRRGDNIVSTVFAEHELAIATRDHIEVR